MVLSSLNNIFENLHFNAFDLYLICFVTSIILFVLNIVLNKKVDLISVAAIVAINVCALLLSTKEVNSALNIIFAILYCLVAVYVLLAFIFYTKCKCICRTRIHDFLKNSEFEYYVQVNNKNKVIDYSLNLLSLIKRDNEGMYDVKFPNFIFNSFNMISLNGEPFNLSLESAFELNYRKTLSRHKNYEFTFTVSDENNNEITYDCLIQPVYFHNTLIAKNIYISVNRMQILESTRFALAECTQNLLDARNQTYVLMSLTSGVVMYFDFQTKMYNSTESFQKYTDTIRQEYDFDEFLSMIHPEDVQLYMDQSSTVNSLRTTRLKFRMFIGSKYYGVIEDSIFLAKDEKLVSLIRVTGDAYKEEASDVVLSTQEANDILENLGLSDIDKMAGATLDLLNRIGKKND